MLPTPQHRGQPQATSRSGNNSRSGVPYFKPNDCFTDKRQARIVGVRASVGRFGSQVDVKMSYNNSLWLWTLRPENPSYTELFNALGADENQWPGSSFMLSLQEDEFSGKSWPTISDIEMPSVKEPKGKRK